MSVGATESAKSTTNLANCFTLIIYFGSSESALMIFVHLATWKNQHTVCTCQTGTIIFCTLPLKSTVPAQTGYLVNHRDARDIMSKYDLPAKTNIKIQCICFLWVWNFVGNSMGTDGIRTHSDKGIFDPRQLINYPRSKQDVSQFVTPSHSMHQVT